MTYRCYRNYTQLQYDFEGNPVGEEVVARWNTYWDKEPYAFEKDHRLKQKDTRSFIELTHEELKYHFKEVV